MKTIFQWGLPIGLGIAAVVQAGLNRKIAGHWGLSTAVLLNSLGIFIVSGIFLWLCASKIISVPDFMLPRLDLKTFQLWYLIPGVLGFSLVLGIPLGIYRIGALQIFLGLIFAQIVTSFMWDWWVEGITFSWNRVIGGLLAFLGVFVASKS